MRRLLLLLTAAAAIGATPGPSQPSRERGPSPRDAQRREARPEPGRHQPAQGGHRPGLRDGRGEPGRPMPEGPQTIGRRHRHGSHGAIGTGSSWRERMMGRRMAWMHRMHGSGPAHGFHRPGPEAFHPWQGRGSMAGPGHGFNRPPQLQGPRPGMNPPGLERRPEIGQDRGRPDAVRERGAAGPENDAPEVKKAREALEKARRALAEADEKYDRALQNARKKPSSEKKPDQPEKKESKRSDKGR